MDKSKTTGVKESGSNCERNRSTGGQARRRKGGTQKQRKRATRATARTPDKERDPLVPTPPPVQTEQKKLSVRKRTKSSSTTASTDTNKSSDKNSKGSSPDKDSDPSSSNTRKSLDFSKEEITNTKTCITAAKSTTKSITLPVVETSKEKTREISIKEKAAKEESDPISERDKNFNMHLAQLFFKRMVESQRTKQNSGKKIDENLEVMPDVSHMSKKVVKKNRSRSVSKSSRIRGAENTDIIKDGVPFWVVPDRKEEVQTADGVMTKTPELLQALDEEGLTMENGKQWATMVEDFQLGKLNKGMIQEDKTSDPSTPFLSMEELEARNEKFFSMDSVVYYTMSNFLKMNQGAIERFKLQQEQGATERRRVDQNAIFTKGASKEEEEMNTCPVTSIRLISDITYSISYDRKNPIKSIKKFKQRYRCNLMRISRENCKKGSREGSRETVSKEAKSKDAKSKGAKSKDRKKVGKSKEKT